MLFGLWTYIAFSAEVRTSSVGKEWALVCCICHCAVAQVFQWPYMLASTALLSRRRSLAGLALFIASWRSWSDRPTDRPDSLFVLTVVAGHLIIRGIRRCPAKVNRSDAHPDW